MRSIINAIASRISGKYLAELGFVCAAQFAAGKVGDALQTVNDGGIGPVWPASGIALAALLLRGYSVWPGVAAGAFLLAFLSPLPHWAALYYAAGTTLAAVLGVVLLRRISKFDSSLSHLRDALGLIILGAFVSSLVSASIGASILYAHLRSWSGLGSAWLVYWLGDSTGVLLLAPVVLTFPNVLRSRERKRITELVLLLALLIIGGVVVFGDFPVVRIKLHILTFAVLPFVMWAAIRFGVGETALSIFLVAAIATVATALGSGPFAANNPLMNAVLLDVFFVVVSVTGLILATAIAERERAEHERERLIRERAEAEARRRLDAIVESSDDAIASGTLDGIIVSWNTGAEKIYGYTEAEAVGKPISMLLPSELPDEEHKILETLKGGCRIEHFETVRVTKTGKRIQVSLTISPIKDSSGRTVGVSGIARDITERKRAEEALRKSEGRFRLAAVAGKMFAYEWDAATDIIVRSADLTEVLGKGEPSETTGQQLLDRIHPDDRESVKAAVAGLSPENRELRISFRMRRRDGTFVWVERTSRAYFDDQGRILRVVGMVSDVTELKQAEEALSGMTRKLVEAQEQERARIARELHDDIGQRLALLTVDLTHLQENRSDSSNEVVDRVQELQQRTAKISADVYSLSHELHSTGLEYLGVVGGIKSWCREFGEKQGMEIDFRSSGVPTSVPPEIGLCLFRVLQEALHNAAKHSGVKRAEVQLLEESGEIHLIVSDLGKGFNVEAGTQGRGLGLTSMQERVRLVNGMISIESKPLSGTTIHVRVPQPLDERHLISKGHH